MFGLDHLRDLFQPMILWFCKWTWNGNCHSRRKIGSGLTQPEEIAPAADGSSKLMV